MNRFRVGDLLTGTEINRYGFTNALATCKVVRVLDDCFIAVVVLKHPTYRGDTEFVVASKEFKLAKPKFKGNR